MTKIEALQRALKELGPEATAPAIQTFLRDRYGIAMTTGHIYAARGELRYRDARNGQSPQ